jgi:hypothetical protein
MSVMAPSHYMAYQQDYKDAADFYKENGKLGDDRCQYYEGTHVPIFTQPGVGLYRGGRSGLRAVVHALMTVTNKYEYSQLKGRSTDDQPVLACLVACFHLGHVPCSLLGILFEQSVSRGWHGKIG